VKAKKLLTALAIVSVVLIAGCKKDEPAPSDPIVIPVQTTEMATVPLSGTVNFAVLAGSAVTSTGATTVTGDLGLLASSLTTTSGRQVILSGGASASNIFWQVGSYATFGTTSVFKGTVLVMQSITFNTGATLDGRALARTGGITMAGNTISFL
jgi:hypothetical protein